MRVLLAAEARGIRRFKNFIPRFSAFSAARSLVTINGFMNDILGKKILFVTAHPDDESYAAAGTILKNHEAGGTSYIACATFGEKGKSHIKRKATSRQMKLLRKKELLAASKYLKVAALLTPGLPDAGLREKSKQDAFFRKLLPFAEKYRPDYMISFGADGISGHMDHIAAGKVAKR